MECLSITRTILPTTKTANLLIDATSILVGPTEKDKISSIFASQYGLQRLTFTIENTNGIKAVTLIYWIFIIGLQFIKGYNMKYREEYEKSVYN